MLSFVWIFIDLVRIFFYWFTGIVEAICPMIQSKKDVSKDVVLITGGGSGLGRLLAVRFAEKGAKVVIWDINETGLKETKKLLEQSGFASFTYVCDISDRLSVYSTSEKVRRDVGDVTILVNNAGVVSGKRFLRLSDDDIEKTFQVNILSHFWICRAFLPAMLEAKSGHIVSICSMAGLIGTPFLSDYSASKYSAIGLQESLHPEVYFDGFTNIKFTTVCPYYMNTGMFAGMRLNVLPVLEPERVADEAMDAILRNRVFVMIPKSFYFLYLLKVLMPFNSGAILAQMLKVHNTMETFVGRASKND